MPRPANHPVQVASNGSPTRAQASSNHSRRYRAEPWRPVLALALLFAALLLLLPLLLGELQEKGARPPEDPPAGQPAPASQPPPTSVAEAFPDVTRDSDGRLQWPRPRRSERQRDRDRMVDQDIARGPFRGAVKDARVLAAMRAVPRHAFVPANRRYSAYDDTPLSIGHGQTISQPYIVALMTELLEVKEGDRVLEIGTGSGYQAAVLNELTPYVYSIEILKPLHEDVVKRFEQLGYKTIQTRLGDGYDGWKEHAPFDGIIVTCAAGHIPPPLWQQLKPGGRMVIPVGGVYETQRLLVLTKQPDGGRKSRTVLPVRFVPMTGKIEKP